MTSPADKRVSPRVAGGFRLRAAGAPEVLEMETVNLSIGGAYCTSRTWLEPMTRLEVHLDLPGHSHLADSITTRAVVVRVEPDGDDGDASCRVALLFQEMADADRARLRRFLGQDGN